MRRLGFVLVWVVELVLVAGAALLLSGWIWSGTDGSLATLLRQVQPYLPAGQTLVVTDVQGAIRGTGRIGTLHWQSGGLGVQATDLRFAWQPLDLLKRRITVTQMAIAQLQLDDQRPPSAPQPPPEVVLPLELDVPFAIGEVRLIGATPIVVSELSGRYRFNDNQHQLDVTSIAVAQGHYTGRLNLQARIPMTLDLQLQGKVSAPVAEGRSIALDASATVRGPLAGSNPHLDLLAQLQPEAGNTGAQSTARAMRATVTAQISPWAAQPVLRAQSSFNHLDLAALWPVGPRTQLTGNAWVRPVGAGWLIDFNLINRLAGPWDKGQLPLESAKGLIELVERQWSVQSLNAEVGGGRIRLQGTLADPSTVSATTGWEGQLQIQGVNPALIYSAAEPVRLDGTLKARAAGQAVEFDANLQPAAGQKTPPGLRGLHVRDAVAHGRWADGWLRLDKLRIRTAQATVEGTIDIALASRTARGQLQLQAPGMQARVSGQFGALDGNGNASLTVTDAARSRAWIARLPMVPTSIDAFDVQGGGELAARWTGGWESVLHNRGTPLELTASLHASRWVIRSAAQLPDQALQLRDLDLRAQGRLDALHVDLRGTASRAGQQAQIVASAIGGREPGSNWTATLRTLQLQLQDPQLPGPWKLVLVQPVRADFSSPSSQWAVAAGQARLSGPQPGIAELAWEPLTMRSGPAARLRSKGTLRGLPMAWMTLLAKTDLNAAGLSGDLVFDGQWDITVAEQIVVRASLGRRSGDLRIHPDGFSASDKPNGAAPAVDAGIRELLLQVQADGDRVAAQFHWDSERAGNAQATFATRLQRGPDGWSWTPDSPLAASVRARMPQVGVWSLLAPPGWRVRGTVDANLGLGGTRKAPQWSGELQASEMAVRSVVDGIEFGNGELRVSLKGQRLNIDRFSLQGAGGASGGALTATGFATWAASEGADASPLQAIALQIDAKADALRVSARADRRLTVSGNLQAMLEQAKLRIRGALTVDQALFILPDETAPTLGDDVIVLRPAKDPVAGDTAPSRRTTAASTPGKTSLQADLQVTLDLGKDFRVRGHGIDTRVAGVLAVSSTLKPGESPMVTGALRTVGGQYRAYGQKLDIERGQMRFGGAYDNPSLDILAIRPQLAQRVGVQITGTALLPRVRLYAEPDLPEAEKLAWLVLGRSGANGGAEAAVLQQAALALLGGQAASGGIASRFGLDELSFSGGADTGSGGTSSATVTLGKRISRNFYVAYERSLAGTLGTFSIFYDLSRRFTLRASTGEKSAIDLIFKYSYD